VNGHTLLRANTAFIVVLLMTCDAPSGSARVRRDSTRPDTLRIVQDSARIRDSSTVAVPAPADSDPPCFASHFGLPCR